MPAKIVALTKNFSVAAQIEADDIPRIAAEGYRVIVNNRPDGEQADQLSSSEAKRRAEESGLAYHYLPVTTATLTLAEVEAFDRLLAGLEGPVLAHCRSGTRCYLLWAAAKVRKGEAPAEALIKEAAERGFDISALARFPWTAPRRP